MLSDCTMYEPVKSISGASGLVRYWIVMVLLPKRLIWTELNASQNVVHLLFPGKLSQMMSWTRPLHGPPHRPAFSAHVFFLLPMFLVDPEILFGGFDKVFESFGIS